RGCAEVAEHQKSFLCDLRGTSATSALKRFLFSLPSKPRQLRERHLAAMDVHTAELGTAVQHREHLAGVEEPVGIEGAFEPLLLRQLALAEHRAHEVALLDADAVLARKDAAHRDAELQDVAAESLGALELARLVGVVEDERVEIAVAGMKDIGDAEPILLR